MLNDLRYALRVLRKDFGFTVAAVLTLALGIGANTAIFTVVNALLLRPLPFDHSERLTVLYVSNPKRVMGRGSFSLMRLDQLRSQSHSVDDLAGSCTETFNLTGMEQPDQLSAARVSSNYLRTLGIHPVVGRDFLPDEDREGGKPVVLMSYGLWQRRFGSDPNIAGKAITLDAQAYTIIGVLPAGLDQPGPGIDLFVTNMAGFSRFTLDQIRSGGGYISGIARLKPGVDLRQAQAEMDVLTRQYLSENAGKIDADPDARMEAGSLQESLVANVRPALLVLSAAVCAILLIACANVASLLLARATGRRKEFGVRAALGASRGDLIRQLLAESCVLAMLGGAVGLAIAAAGTRLLDRMSQQWLPRSEAIQLDWQPLAFTVLVSIVTGLLFGLLPAFQFSKPDLNTILRESGRGTAGSVRRNRARSVLVIGQVAASMILLIVASLLMRSFLVLQQVDPGFDPRNVLTMQITLPAAKYPTNSQKTIFFREAIDKISAIPGVRSASAVLNLPMIGRVLVPIQAAGDSPLPFGKRPLVNWQSITPDYFRTIGTRLIRGRLFNDHDNESAAGAAIINEAMARRFWPNQDAIGQRLIVARAELHVEVVGVVADVKDNGLDTETFAELYSPYAQRPWPAMNLAVRTSGDPMAVASAVRREISEVDRDLPVTGFQTLESIVASTFGQRRLTLWLLGVFAAMALLLAAIGIYGLLAYSVEQRRQEMGIRQALGARPRDILSLVIRQGIGLTLAGVAVGLAGALAITRVLTTLLFHVSPTDPLVFVATAVLFLLLAAVSSYLPARRAVDADPLTALRD